MGHTQKCITGTQPFPISKLGGWKDTTAFHKSSKANQHHALKHLRQYWCYGNWPVIGNRRGRWTFRNWCDIGLFPASRETTQTNEPPKHYTKTGGHNISSYLKKKRKHQTDRSALKRSFCSTAERSYNAVHSTLMAVVASELEQPSPWSVTLTGLVSGVTFGGWNWMRVRPRLW